MGLGSAVRGGLGLLNPQHHGIDPPSSNQTPSLALTAFWNRPRDMPLPLTPFAVLRSLVQLDDIQALLWAWMLVGLILALAYWSNPSDSSFRPFLTDFTFRERLRCLHDGADGDTLLDSGSSAIKETKTVQQGGASAAFRSSLFSTSPFATTFGSKLSLSVRTPPYLRKDFYFFSIVTISHSMPLHYVGASSHDASTTASADARKSSSDGASDFTSVFVGLFGRYWTAVYGLPLQRLTGSHLGQGTRTTAADREELEENRNGLSDWGVLEMRSADREHALADPSVAREVEKEIEHRRASCTSDTSGERHADSKRSRSRSSSPHTANRTAASAPMAATSGVSAPLPHPDLDASDVAAMLTAVTDSQTAVTDLQEQLRQLRANSTKACEGLQGDLDELRSRKRDEDKVRMEVKSKTKALEESKRQAEQARREAERRLKAASNARSSKQASIAAKKEEMEALLKRRANHAVKLQASSTRRTERIAEARDQTTDAQERLRTVKELLVKLRADVQTAEESLSVEKTNLQAAFDGQPLRDREHGKVANGGFASPGFDSPHREIDVDPFAPIDASGRAVAPYDGFSSAPLRGFQSQQHLFAPAPKSHFDAFGEPIDANAGMRPFGSHFGPPIPPPPAYSRAEDAAGSAAPAPLPTAKVSGGLGTSVLRNAFRKATGAAPFSPKGFEGATAPAAGDGAAADDVLGAANGATEANGGMPNFEAMKQAFQPTLASEEEGRRSWSAFDMWQSDLRDARHRLQWSNGLLNGSADSLPHLHAGGSGSGSVVSSMLSPLDRSNSAGYAEPTKDEAGMGDAEQMRNLTKVKRAFRWPFRPSQIQGEVL